MNTKEKLDKLYEMQAEIDKVKLHYDALKAGILTPEIRKQLNDIDLEMGTELDNMKLYMDDLANQIKNEVIAAGSTIKGSNLMAVWNKGRVSWDTKGLDGYAVAHPEMSAFRSVGSPTVTIRKA